MFDKQLIKLRDDFDNQIITKVDFIRGVDAVFQDIKNQPDADKVAAFDKIIDFISQEYGVGEIEYEPNEGRPMVGIKNDLNMYLFDVVFISMFGSNFFDFYNQTYISY
jgi:hypothetical protein